MILRQSVGFHQEILKNPQEAVFYVFRMLVLQSGCLDAKSLLEIKFFPKKADGTSFSGTAWLNPQTQELVQVFLNCQHCAQQPFVALFESDSLQQIDFQVQCAFGPKKDGAALTHIKAFYDITYLSRVRQENSSLKHYHGEASIQVYKDQANTMQPHFDFLPGVDIYRKIMAFPYAAAFWANNPAPFPAEQQALRNQFFYEKSDHFQSIDRRAQHSPQQNF